MNDRGDVRDDVSPPAVQAELLRLAVDFDPSGLIVIDGGGNIVFVNRAIERLFDYARAELVGQRADLLVPDRLRVLHPFRPGDPARVRSGPGRAAFEVTGLRKNGTELPIEIELNPVLTDRGVLTFASVVDVSKRKEAEELFRVAVESSPSGMVMVDPNGRIVLVNRETERLLGYSRGELVGQPLELIVPERFRQAHRDMRARFGQHPTVRPMGAAPELLARRKDGVEIPVQIALNPMETNSGTFVLSSLQDIRARRDLELQLQQAQKMEALGALAGGIAHDFNNLLRAIVGFTEEASRSAGANAALQRDLEQVLKAAERGRMLVERMLTLSRRRDAPRQSLRLQECVAEGLEFLRASLPRSVEIHQHLDPATPPIIGDETEMNQVLLNLATNAAHAMGETGGVLEIRVEPFTADEPFARSHPPLRPGPCARLVVADTGCGMPPEVLERALDPFFTTKTEGVGTGLGLPIVHGIVMNQRGAIELQSTPRQGTTIHIYLPSPEVEPVRTPPTPHPASEPERPHIMLLEDETMLVQLGAQQLEDMGFHVTAHTSSYRALDDFRARPDRFTAVITDNKMPQMSGLALAREMIRVRPDIRILMVSGLAEGTDAQSLCSAGVKMVLHKPHTGSELAQAVRQLLAG